MSDVKISDTSGIYSRLKGYLKPYWKAFLLALICNAAYGYLDTEFIKAIKPLLDEGLFKKNSDYLILAPLFVIAILIFRGIFSFISAYCMAYVGNNMTRTMRKEIFHKYLLLPAKYFDTHKTGELLSKVTYNTEQLNRSTTDAVTNVVRNVAIIVFALVGLFMEDWQLTLLFLITAPLIALIVRVTTKRFRKISSNIQTAMGDITHVTQEGVESHQEIKIYGGQFHEEQQFSIVNKKNYYQMMKMEVTKALSVPVIQLLAGLGLALVLYFAVGKVVNGDLTAGGFISMVALMMLTLKPLKSLSSINATLQRGIAAAESVFDVLDEKPEKDQGTKSLNKSTGKLNLKNLSFKYNKTEDYALNNINVEIPSGKTIALVGRSGSGKSTLASVLLRFYNIDSGQLLLDDHPVEDYKLADYRNQIAYVAQTVTLFNDSIRNNIAYGCLNDKSETEIIAAAEKAHAWEFIKELPEGLDTKVGERGALLSGGQRQRIAIARAILKDAPILILDEATSALDTESEKKIQEAMNTVMNNRTTVVVAHRLSTIENADKILVMDKGEIKESGSHEELIKQGGIYCGLHQMQFKG